MLAFAASSATVAAQGERVEHLVPINKTASTVTGSLVLHERGSRITRIDFANGTTLTLIPSADGSYRIRPASDPVLLRGKRLCSDGPPTSINVDRPGNGAVTISVYDGRDPDEDELCADFRYHTDRR